MENLLKIFPRIKSQVPEAECYILSGMSLYGIPEADEDFKSVYALTKQPGIHFLGPQSKPAMAKIFAQSRVLAYPNIFAETFCITALEAQAAGLPVVTSNYAAMKERVIHGEDGYLIAGPPITTEYENKFVEYCCELLTQEERWALFSKAAKTKSDDFRYNRLAQNWTKLFEQILDQIQNKKRQKFIPCEQNFDLLVDGYSKNIHLSQKIIQKVYAAALKENGFIERTRHLTEG